MKTKSISDLRKLKTFLHLNLITIKELSFDNKLEPEKICRSQKSIKRT